MNNADEQMLKTFINHPDEVMVFAVRKHSFVLISPLFLTTVFSLILIVFSFYGLVSLFNNVILFMLTLLTIISLWANLTAKIIIDWYFHFYVVTTKKFLEVKYSPLSHKLVSDVLLEQVRCTEIDVKTSGILNQLIEMGDINITFDRPTHQEEFVFQNIKNPKEVSNLLFIALDPHLQTKDQAVWYKDKTKDYKFTDEVFPRPLIRIN